MHRRRFLAAGAAGAALGLAGCRSLFETRSARAPPLVEDRPDAVYYPTHVEGMEMVGRGEAGDYGVALTYSFPHRFWTVESGEPNKVDIRGQDSIHLMSSVWDRETGTVVPNSSITATVTRDDETVTERGLWLMLSQNMGIHAGDNVALDGDGTYEVAIDAGAVSPMEMEMLPVAQLPEPADLPGTLLAEERSGDAVFPALRLDETPDGVDGSGPYLAVSPRTPYNRYPLPRMTLAATVARDGATPFDDTLAPTAEPGPGIARRVDRGP